MEFLNGNENGNENRNVNENGNLNNNVRCSFCGILLSEPPKTVFSSP
jgi:hypothetical protein